MYYGVLTYCIQYAADWNLAHCRPSLFPPNLDRFVFEDHLLDLKPGPGALCNQSALFFPRTFRLIALTPSRTLILTMARKGPGRGSIDFSLLCLMYVRPLYELERSYKKGWPTHLQACLSHSSGPFDISRLIIKYRHSSAEHQSESVTTDGRSVTTDKNRAAT